MLEFLFGAWAGKVLLSSSEATDSEYELEQIRKVLEIGNAINLMGETLPPDTDITEAVEKLKTEFDAIDGSAIRNAAGRQNYLAVKEFFDRHGVC